MLTKSDLGQIKDVVKDAIRPLEKDIKDVKKTVDTMARLLDSADVKIEKRVRRIEDHLSLTDKN